MNPSNSAPQQEFSALQAGTAAGLPVSHTANWDEEEPLPRRLSATEARAFRDQRSAPSPWRVLLVQALVGIAFTLVIGLLFGRSALWSGLFGAVTAVVPGAMMARGATRLADSKSPLTTALGLLGWESAKLVYSMAMLVSASRVLHPVVWPALLATLAGCLSVYWVALTWRSR